MYLYNKNILEYAHILVTSGRFMIFHIEGYFTPLIRGIQDCSIGQNIGQWLVFCASTTMGNGILLEVYGSITSLF